MSQTLFFHLIFFISPRTNGKYNILPKINDYSSTQNIKFTFTKNVLEYNEHRIPKKREKEC